MPYISSPKQFSGSETTRVKVDIYSFGDEKAFNGKLQTSAKQSLYGPDPVTEDGPRVVGVDIGPHSIGVPATPFSISIKIHRSVDIDYFVSLQEDDWVDISYTRWDVSFHRLRGQIVDIRKLSKGPSTTIVISGESFGRPFVKTPTWLSIDAQESGVEAYAYGQLDGLMNLASTRPPADVVERILSLYLREYQNIGRTNWELPPALSAMVGTNAFIESVAFFKKDFINFPYRTSPVKFQTFNGYDTSIWALAMAFSDAPLCELFTDLMWTTAPLSISQDQPLEGEAGPVIGPLLPLIKLGDPGFPRQYSKLNYFEDANLHESTRNSSADYYNNYDVATTVPTVIYRNRPFPTTDVANMREGPWFNRIPAYRARRTQCASIQTGRSGEERRNAFYLDTQEVGRLAWLDASMIPLWNPASIARHGPRRMPAKTRYLGADRPRFVNQYRGRLRDFHCLNHLFLSGEISFTHLRPDIHIGGKLHLFSGSDTRHVETYYIEQLKETWRLGSGNTTLGVTRGWIGDASENDFLSALKTEASKYVLSSGKIDVEDT